MKFWFFILALLLVSLITACADQKLKCKTDEECGYSCTYGCVAASWYNNQEESQECSTAHKCACIQDKCSIVADE